MTTAIASALISLAASIVATTATLWIARHRLRREYLLEFQAESLARSLLLHKKWRLRTFKTIQHHVAGFKEDDLRQILVRAGAVRFSDAAGEEIWGLIERNQDLLDREYGTSNN